MRDDWRDRPMSNRAQQNDILATEIKTVFDKERGRAGAKRITKRLKQQGIQAGRHRVARIMGTVAKKFFIQKTVLLNKLSCQSK